MTDNLCDICAGKYPPHVIFVFGSNELGIHGAGAALHAVQHHGAERGVGYGPRDQSFAIPTRDWVIETLPRDRIRSFVQGFLAFAKLNPQQLFYITRIGCGFAGYTEADIAPMFVNAPINCILPEGWRKEPSHGGLTG